MEIKKSRILSVVAWLCLIIGMIPFPTESVPEWKVTAVNKNDIPVPGVELAEEWRFSNTSPSMSREIQVTDENGVAIFPARTNLSPLFLRAALFGFDFVNFFVGHGSPMGGYAVVDSKDSDYIVQYIDGKKKDKLTITRPKVPPR
jgi:hypothetical protein